MYEVDRVICPECEEVKRLRSPETVSWMSRAEVEYWCRCDNVIEMEGYLYHNDDGYIDLGFTINVVTKDSKKSKTTR